MFRGEPKIVDLTTERRLATKVEEAQVHCTDAERDEVLYYFLAKWVALGVAGMHGGEGRARRWQHGGCVLVTGAPPVAVVGPTGPLSHPFDMIWVLAAGGSS